MPVGTVLVQPASDPDDGWTLRTLVLQLLGLATGILLARFGDVRLFTTFLQGGQAMPAWLDYVLTGLFIGGGSGPAHVLIQFISERKVTMPTGAVAAAEPARSEEHTSELQSLAYLVCRLLLEKKKKKKRS